MQLQYPVKVDRKGHILIPADVRRSLGITPMSMLLMAVENGELRLMPSEIMPKRRIREISREELAQGLIDGAVTPKGTRDAREAIRDLGLDPKQFHSQFD